MSGNYRKFATKIRAAALAAAALLPGGCAGPTTQWSAAETQSRVLAEQNRAQLAEIENLKTHAHNTEDQLARAEQELAAANEQATLSRRRLAGFQHETDQIREDLKGLAGVHRLPEGISKQLADLGRRYPDLHFDPAGGVSRLQADVLFQNGQAQNGQASLQPAARAMLVELAQILQSPEAKDLKVMVVGHTEDQPPADRATGEPSPNNFHLSAAGAPALGNSAACCKTSVQLSTARALAVAELLRSEGLSAERVGVAGFAAHEPAVANASPAGVEIFVMPPDVPVVGWSGSIPGACF
jgi:flagellar motor protein MotB